MSSEISKSRGIRDFRDSRVAAVASEQFGVVSTRQLRAAGLDADAVRRRVDAGRLHPLLTGVVAVGHRALTRDGWFMAALLSFGVKSVLSHFSAAMVHGVWKYRVGEIHVKVPGSPQPRPRVVTHRCASPYVTIDGLRVTTIEQTILDMATVVRSDKAYRRMVREALVQELITYDQLVEFAARNDGVRGIKRLRHELAKAARTRSTFEDEVLDHLREQGLDPDPNLLIDGSEVDLFLADLGLVIEVDGPAHDNPLAAYDDAVKQAGLEALGLQVLRVPRR